MINNSIKALVFFSLIVIGFYACRIKGCQEVPVKACAPPTQLTTAAITDTTITVKWNAPEGVGSFEVSIKSVDLYGESAPVLPPVITTESKHTFTGLTPNTLYEVQVKSVCGIPSSSPATIQARTGTIIIVDIISQRNRPGSSIISDRICNGMVVETDTLAWNNEYPNELLHLTLRKGSSAHAEMVITKSIDSNTGKYYFEILDEKILCEDSRIRFNPFNPPLSFDYTSNNSAQLNGTNYTINLSTTGVSVQNNNLTISGVMYR